MSGNPPEDKGQAGTVHLVETNEWAYRYEVGGVDHDEEAGNGWPV